MSAFNKCLGLNIIIVFFLLSKAGAESLRRPAAVEANKYGQKSRVQSIVPGPIASARQQIIRELVSAETPKLEWPPFPRVWLERSRTEIKSSNTSLGLKIPVLNSGAKVSVDYKYGLKTTLIIISSKRKKLENDIATTETEKLNGDDNDTQIIRFDDETNTTYPNVKKDLPMVGLCVYEASLNIEKSSTLNFNFVSFNQELNSGTLEVISQAVFSNFFQLDSNTPIIHYIKTVCGEVFRQDVEQSVASDFSKMVLERLVSDNPLSQCAPEHEGEKSKQKLELGDKSCFNWHIKNHTEVLRKITVPRCELQRSGSYQCVLKAKAGTACSMFIDPKTKKYSEHFDMRSHSIRATKNHFEYDCDQKQGLTCELYEKPKLLLGVPFFEGRAQCVQASQ